jgi:hypothetical protein
MLKQFNGISSRPICAQTVQSIFKVQSGFKQSSHCWSSSTNVPPAQAEFSSICWTLEDKDATLIRNVGKQIHNTVSHWSPLTSCGRCTRLFDYTQVASHSLVRSILLIRSPDRTARSQSLYRLSYLGPYILDVPSYYHVRTKHNYGQHMAAVRDEGPMGCDGSTPAVDWLLRLTLRA